MAISLLRRFGRNDAVFFYNKGIEVDFYIPERAMAIQVCYSMSNNNDTFDREVNGLLKLQKVLPCDRLIIVTRDEENILELAGRRIEVIPIWRWLMGE